MSTSFSGIVESSAQYFFYKFQKQHKETETERYRYGEKKGGSYSGILTMALVDFCFPKKVHEADTPKKAMMEREDIIFLQYIPNS